jgi:hypothetical protein
VLLVPLPTSGRPLSTREEPRTNHVDPAEPGISIQLCRRWVDIEAGMMTPLLFRLSTKTFCGLISGGNPAIRRFSVDL